MCVGHDDTKLSCENDITYILCPNVPKGAWGGVCPKCLRSKHLHCDVSTNPQRF